MIWLTHIVAVVGFLAFGGVSYWTWIQAAAQKEFIEVQARILDSYVREFVKSSSSSRGSPTSTRHYAAEIRYAYEIGGQRHESDRIRFLSGSSSDPSSAREAVASYPQGAVVTAYVDPNDSENSLLEKGVPRWFTAAFAGGAVVWLALWELAARAVRKKKAVQQV